MPANDDRERELGALWLKQGQRGEFMTGTLTIDGQAIQVVCFPTDPDVKRMGNNRPDWRVLRSRPREDAPQRGPSGLIRPLHSAQSRDYPPPNVRPRENELDDEIPF